PRRGAPGARAGPRARTPARIELRFSGYRNPGGGGGGGEAQTSPKKGAPGPRGPRPPPHPAPATPPPRPRWGRPAPSPCPQRLPHFYPTNPLLIRETNQACLLLLSKNAGFSMHTILHNIASTNHEFVERRLLDLERGGVRLPGLLQLRLRSNACLSCHHIN